LEDADGAPVGERVAFEVVGEDEDNEVGDGEEGDDGGVFEGVEAAEEGEWDDNEPGVGLVYKARAGRRSMKRT
jgi:hypothetical protein